MENSKKNEKISQMEKDSFYDTAEEADFSLSPDSGVHNMSEMDPESKAKLEEEWTRELARTEEEINTLRQVLSSKMRRQAELKRKLGITVWKEFREDMEQGIHNLQETSAYQKSSHTLKRASEITSGALGTFTARVSKIIEDVKQSPAIKTFEDKVGSAYSDVKSKVSGMGAQQSSDSRSKEEPLIPHSNESENTADKS